jgi:N-acetylmuramoyl-L-alanine amidase
MRSRVSLPASLFVLALSPAALALEHRVVAGDTLGKLAQRHGVSVSEIQAANGLQGDLIRIGEVLVIPEAGLGAAPKARFHRVRSGDTLSHLALRYRTTVRRLRQANGIQGDLIRVGQLLRVPGRTAPATTTLAASAATHTIAAAAPAPAPKPAQATLVVQSGDTLSQLAAQAGTTVEALMSVNGLTSHLIHPGQHLAVASSGAKPASSVSASRAARIAALGYTQADVEILARIIKGEAPRHTPWAGKVAVGAVVLNRVLSKRWPGSIRRVVHQPWQFSAYNKDVRQRLYGGPIPDYAWRAAEAALAGQDPTRGATHYFNPFLVRPSWAKTLTFVKRIGHTKSTTHVFYR